MRACVLIIAGTLGICSEMVVAQTDSGPKFEAVSIKRSAPDSATFMKAHPGGKLEFSGVTLTGLIALAYRVQEYQVSGAPAWGRTARFSVNTTAAENPSSDRLFQMMQALLAERFSLKQHLETKEEPVYLLIARKAGNRPATGLQVTTEGSCVKVEGPAPPDPNACGSLGMGSNHLDAHEISMARLADALGRVLHRKVIDKTGLSEKFNVSLRWNPDDLEQPPPGDAAKLSSDIPSIFVAIREQLSLGLEASKAPIEVLVVDQVEMPTEN